MSYIRGLGAIDTSPCTQNPNDPVCVAARAPTIGAKPDPWGEGSGSGVTDAVSQVATVASNAISSFMGLLTGAPATLSPTTPPAPGKAPAPKKSKLPALLAVGGVVAIGAFLMLRKPKSNPYRRRRR